MRAHGPWTRIAMAAACCALFWSLVAGAAYPDKPVRIVVGFAPGGSDISARVIAQKLSDLWGQGVVIENRAGAAGNIGAEAVARAPADGYTLLLCVNSYTINTTVYRNLGWDLVRDFAPVGRFAVSPLVLVVHPSLPVRSVRELIDHARANAGKLNYGSAGNGTAPHLAGELFAMNAGLSMTHIAYKGSGPSVTALLANEVQLSFGALSAFDAFIKDGRLRPIAVTTAERSPQMPGMPTVIESGMAGFDADIWYGLLLPAKTPADIVAKVGADLARVMADPDTQARLRQRGLEPAYLDARQMGDLIKRDVARWRGVAERIKLTLD
jgi:tripartite-type tricarboxylate transporter receptor subunit TctC